MTPIRGDKTKSNAPPSIVNTSPIRKPKKSPTVRIEEAQTKTTTPAAPPKRRDSQIPIRIMDTPPHTTQASTSTSTSIHQRRKQSPSNVQPSKPPTCYQCTKIEYENKTIYEKFYQPSDIRPKTQLYNKSYKVMKPITIDASKTEIGEIIRDENGFVELNYLKINRFLKHGCPVNTIKVLHALRYVS